MPFSLYWRVRKQDEGCLLMFFTGQLSLCACSLQIFWIPQETLWKMGVLSLTWWTPHWGKTLKEPLNNTLPHKGWVTIACTLFSWPQLTNTNTHAHPQTWTKTTSWFQKRFSGLANVASWPRHYRGRGGMETMVPKILHQVGQQEMQTASLWWLSLGLYRKPKSRLIFKYRHVSTSTIVFRHLFSFLLHHHLCGV